MLFECAQEGGDFLDDAGVGCERIVFGEDECEVEGVGVAGVGWGGEVDWVGEDAVGGVGELD